MEIEENLLIERFNNRHSEAFSEVYLLYYDELFYFASKLYKGTEVSPNDVLQDTFINLWETKKQRFNELINIKAYLFISIKNSFKNYITHRKQIEKHSLQTQLDDDNFITFIAETELFSVMNEAINLLPDECAKVFKCYLEELTTKEIAIKLNKSENTVYAQRRNAIAILRKKLSKEKMLLLIILLK